jgi:uncharacterized protein
MKIGVLSDSHDYLPNVEKAMKIFVDEDVKLIVHCGDIVAPFIKMGFGPLESHPIEMIGVYGNNDGERAGIRRLLKGTFNVMGDFYETEREGKKIAIYHGTYAPLLENTIDSQNYDLVLTGHTHQVRIEKRGKTLVVNPGATYGYFTGKASCAVIDISGTDLKEENVQIFDLK